MIPDVEQALEGTRMTDRAGVASRGRRLINLYGPPLVAVLYLFPRVTHARFGLLDDGITLTMAPGILAHPWSSLTIQQAHGRFVPGYWLYWSFWYWLGGAAPAVFYLSNLLMLASAVGALNAIMRRCGAKGLEIWCASLIFIFSLPVSEAYFTLSKGEPAALLALLCCVLLAFRATSQRRPLLAWTAVFVLFMGAVATRETSVALVGVVAAWLGLALIRPAAPADPMTNRSSWILLAILTAACLPELLGGIWLRASAPPGTYAASYQLSAATVIRGFELRSYELLRDWPMFCLLAVVGLGMVWRQQARRPMALLMMLAWAAGSLAILLPWPDLHPYYLLNFAAAGSMASGLVLADLIVLARAGKRWAQVSAILAGLLAVIVGVNSFSASRYQIMIDDANGRLVDYLKTLPPHSIVLVNMVQDHEYLFELRLHLEVLFNRRDLRFAPLTFAAPDARDAGHPYYVVSFVLRHGRFPAVRGIEPDAVLQGWESSWIASRGRALSPLAEFKRTRLMMDVSTERVWCALMRPVSAGLAASFCPAFDRPLDLGQAEYGWRVDRYDTSAPPVRAASFADGVWSIQREAGPALSLAIGEPGDVPIAADWDGDGLLDPGVYRPRSRRWLVPLSSGGRLDFEVSGMTAADIPVAGDWLGAGHALPGFYRPGDATWHLFSANGVDAAVPVFGFGNGTARPLVGDWDGDRRATPGFYQPETGAVTLIDAFRSDASQSTYTLPAGQPAVVSWSGGVDTVNGARPGGWHRRIANCACDPSNAPEPFNPAVPPGEYFAGRWSSAAPPPAIRR
jgi:hypothetical protein